MSRLRLHAHVHDVVASFIESMGEGATRQGELGCRRVWLGRGRRRGERRRHAQFCGKSRALHKAASFTVAHMCSCNGCNSPRSV